MTGTAWEHVDFGINPAFYDGYDRTVFRPDFCGFIMDLTANSEMWNIEEFGCGPWCD